MDSKETILDQSGDGKVVKQIGERLPHFRVSVLTDTFVVETIHLSDLATVVIASEKEHTVGPSHLQCNH